MTYKKIKNFFELPLDDISKYNVHNLHLIEKIEKKEKDLDIQIF